MMNENNGQPKITCILRAVGHPGWVDKILQEPFIAIGIAPYPDRPGCLRVQGGLSASDQDCVQLLGALGAQLRRTLAPTTLPLVERAFTLGIQGKLRTDQYFVEQIS